MSNPYYTDYAAYLERFFPGRKIQKISVNTGGSCPNHDGTIGTGGCIYCKNSAFTPQYCFTTHGVRNQLEAGKKFFAKKYPNMQYLAYFQSYTSTHAKLVDELRAQYEEALATDGVVGLIIGTRPDCIDAEIAGMLAEINKTKPVFVEFGVETMHDDTLRMINRGHTAQQTEEAIKLAANHGLHVGVHLIAGLPGESVNDLMDSVTQVCSLPVESIKLHHLQVLRGTELERRVNAGELQILKFSVEEYIDICKKIVNIVPRKIAIERFLASAPPADVVSPKWGLKNFEFTNLLLNRLRNPTKENK